MLGLWSTAVAIEKVMVVRDAARRYRECPKSL